VAVRTLDDAIIYEMHVGGFTRDPSSGVRHPGTFAGHAPGTPMLHVVLNMNADARDAELPALDDANWRRMVDTAAEAPADIVSAVETARVERGACRVEARSVVVLESRRRSTIGLDGAR
jgi:pullulanase/glycogen debranching enzyme